MFFPVALEVPTKDTEAYGVIVPDLPGCHSAGDTLEEAMANVHVAIDMHLSGLEDDNEQIPVAKRVSEYMGREGFVGMVWFVVEVDISRYLGKSEKVNVTLPANLIRRIDSAVAAGAVDPRVGRSGFLAEAALEKLQRSKAA